MIFRQWQQVLDGTKTQTRRLVKKGDYKVWNLLVHPPKAIAVRTRERIRWEVGRTYAVQPGRGQKAVGHFRITRFRRERLQAISDEDIEAEGIFFKSTIAMMDCGWSNSLDGLLYPRREWAFKALWNSINKKPGTRWIDNPEVWVRTFEVVK